MALSSTPLKKKQRSLLGFGFATTGEPRTSVTGVPRTLRASQELQRQLEETQAKDLARQKLKEETKAGALVDPAAFGRGFTGGRPVGRRTGVAAGESSNRRRPGDAVLRRDKGAIARLNMILAVEEAASAAECEPEHLAPSTMASLCERFAESRRSLLALLPRKQEYAKFVQERRLGRTGLRPFGSKTALCNLGNSATGARLRNAPGDKPTTQQPLQGIFHKLKNWFNQERIWGHEIRPTHLRIRFQLHLEREVAYQEALAKAGRVEHNPDLLHSAAKRLASYRSAHWRRKQMAVWEKRILFKAIDATFRAADRRTSNSSALDAQLAKITWQGIDRALWLSLHGTQEDLEILVRDPVSWRAGLAQTPIVMWDHTPLWIKYSGAQERMLMSAMKTGRSRRARNSGGCIR